MDADSLLFPHSLFYCNSPLFKRWASNLINCNQEKERFDSTMVQRNFNSQSSQLFEISDKLEVCILCLKYGVLEGNSAVKQGAFFFPRVLN